MGQESARERRAAARREKAERRGKVYTSLDLTPGGRDAPVDSEDVFPRALLPPAWLTARKTAAVLAVLFLGFVAWRLMGQLSDLLITIFISLFLSIAMEPGVKFLADRGWRRGLATWLIFGVFLILTIIFIAAIIPAVIDQVGALARSLPDYLADFERRLELQDDNPLSGFLTPERIEGIRTALANAMSGILDNALGIGLRVLSGILKLFTIGLITWYLAADGPKWRRALARRLPPHRQQQFLDLYELAMTKMGGYVYSRLLLAAIAGGSTFVVLFVLQVPYAFVLGFFVGVTSFIPVIGTYIGAVVPILIATVGRSIVAGVIVLIWIVIYQQVENTFIGPKITQRTLDMHPAIAFVSVLAGGALLGAVGSLLAIPVAGIILGIVEASAEAHETVHSEFFQGRVLQPDGGEASTTIEVEASE